LERRSRSGFALSLELTGFNPKIAGTCMALFQSAGSAPQSYMTLVDGRGYGLWGVRGLLALMRAAFLRQQCSWRR
jgi:hypothetical protein